MAPSIEHARDDLLPAFRRRQSAQGACGAGQSLSQR
jgi:hypothetical protein